MAITVKRYDSDTKSEALPGAYGTAASTPESLGAGVGKALSTLGAHAYQDELLRQDQVAFLEGDRKMSAWENDALYNPETGALSKRGKDAFGVPDTVGKAHEEYSQEVRKGLTTERQRVAFDKAVQARRGDIDKTLARHVFGEARKFEDTETENYIATAKQAAVSNFQDSARVDLEIARGSAAVTDYAKRNGLGPEYVKQKTAQIRSDTTSLVIDRFLANGQDQAAKAYFDATKDRIAGDDITKVEAKLKVASTMGEGQRGSVAVWEKLGPKGDLDPINLDKMIEDARKTYGDKPEVFKAVSDSIKERANIHNAAQRERRESNSSIVWKDIDAGVPMTKVAMTPEFLALPGQEQRNIKEHMTNYTRQQADRGGDDGLYYQRMTEASSPALRDSFIQRNLMEDRPKLSRPMFNHLTELQASMRKGDDKSADKLMASERQQSRMVDEALIGMKLDPTPNEKTAPAKVEQIVGFRRAVREAVRSQEVRSGKNATDAEVQSIVDGLVIEGVTKKGLIFDDKKRVYQLQPGEGVTVKVTDVPRAEREKIEAALRNNNKPINDDTVVKLYQERLLRMRGLPQPKGSGTSSGY